MLKFDATPISMFKIPCSVFDIQCDTRVVGRLTNNV